MHVALLVLIDPAPLDEEAFGTSVDDLTSLVTILDRRPWLPVAVCASAPLLEHVAEKHVELAALLPRLNVEWIQMGWGEPDFGAIPEDLIGLAISKERALHESLGLDSGCLFVRHRWIPRLPALLAGVGVERLLVSRNLTDSVEPGVVNYLDKVLPLAVVAGPGTEASPDSIVGWAIVASELEDVATAVADKPGVVLTKPGDYLSEHPVRGQRRITPSEYRPKDPDASKLWRKHVRMATRLTEKPSDRVLREVLGAAHTLYLSDSATNEQRMTAHRALVRARAVIDTERKRGEDWGRATRIDWDADGEEELQIELADISLVLAPERGDILVLDHKSSAWPVGEVTGRGGSLCRIEAKKVGFAVGDVIETKGEVALALTALDVDCDLRVSGSRVEITYRPSMAGRFGPELAFAISGGRVRVDGGEWRELGELVSLQGHRIRIDGDGVETLISCMVPADVGIQGVEGGIMVRPSWVSEGSGSYEISFDLSPS